MILALRAGRVGHWLPGPVSTLIGLLKHHSSIEMKNREVDFTSINHPHNTVTLARQSMKYMIPDDMIAPFLSQVSETWHQGMLGWEHHQTESNGKMLISWAPHGANKIIP